MQKLLFLDQESRQAREVGRTDFWGAWTMQESK